jgi:hypothetical protein
VNRTLRIWIIVVAGTILVWGLAGFLLAPHLIRSAILDAAGKSLVTRPTLERVRVNPFALSIALERFGVPDRTGRIAVGFDRLYLRLDPFGPFRGGWSLRELRLTRPVANLALLPDSTLNLVHLLRPAPEAAPADTAKEPTPFLVHRLILEDGSVHYADLTRTPAFEKSLQPIRLELQDFSTRRDSRNRYRLEAASEAGERLYWSGSFTVQPFRSDGTLRIAGIKARTLQSYIGELMPFDFQRGEIDFGAGYRLDAAATASPLVLDHLVADVREFALAEKRTGTALIQVGRASARGGGVDAGARVLTLDSLRVDGAEVLSWMTPDNRINYQSWAGTAPPDTSTLWTTRVTALDARGVTYVFEDRRFPSPASFRLSGGTARVDRFSTAPGTRFPVSFACSLGASGRGAGKGEVSMTPTADLELDVTGFDVRSIQPYVALSSKIDILGGTADARGRLRFNAFGARGPLLRFEGRASSRKFTSVDHKLQKDFLKWGRMDLEGLALDVAPTRTVVREVLMAAPYIRAVVAPDRTTNFAALAVSPDSGPAAFRSTSPDTPYTRIDVVRVKNGSMYFADLTLTPNFATGIEKLEGEIRELSSAEAAHAAVNLVGQVDAYAPVSITGTLNPLNGQSDVDLSLVFKNIELTTFTPYSGKFAGYKVDRGKLHLDLNYKIHGRQLVGENKVVLDQLTLGERVESDDATKLPVRFAIALLKDRHGVIDLDIPVKGDLNDPKFSIGRIILKILLNLITKAVTSPFKLLGAAFGGGGGDDDQAWIVFPPGSAVIAPAETLKVSELARGLADRPGLRLEVQECVDLVRDSVALVRRHFDDKLRRARTAGTAGGEAIAPAEYEELLTRVYVAQFGKLKGPDAPRKIKGKRGDPAYEAAVAEERRRVTELMESRVLATVRLDPGELAELGRRRAAEVRDAVVGRAGIAQERVFIVAHRGEVQADTAGVRVSLLLTD